MSELGSDGNWRPPKSQERGCGRPKPQVGMIAKVCADCGTKANVKAEELVCLECGGPLSSGVGQQ